MGNTTQSVMLRRIIGNVVFYALVALLMSLPLMANAHGGDDRRYSVLFVHAAHSNKAKVHLLQEQARSHGFDVTLKSEQEFSEMLPFEQMAKKFQLIVLDGVSVRETKTTYEKYAPLITTLETRVLPVNWVEGIGLRNNIDQSQAKLLFDYWSNGGVDNMRNMLSYLRHRVFEQSDHKFNAPVIFPNIGIYHPRYENLIFADLDSYQQWAPNQGDVPVIGIMLQRSLIESGQLAVIDAAISAFENQGVNVLPFYFELSPMASDYSSLLEKNGQVVPDLLVNFRNIHWANKRKIEFEKLGIPVLQALTFFDGDRRKWAQDNMGISPGMAPFQLVLPEAAGVMDPTIVAASSAETGRAEIIDYQLNHLVQRALKLAQLRDKANADKKVSIMIWGDTDVGASFLNVPDSLHQISERLAQEGYSIDAQNPQWFVDRVDKILSPFYREYALKELLADDMAALLPVAAYRQWFDRLPEDVREPIAAYWGEPEDNFMVVTVEGEKQFVIPRMRNGNMLVLRQPPRSDKKDDERDMFHERTIPMNHYYLAAYYYVREHWSSDAIVHLGTHGSQEYLPGKERGLSAYDQGNLAIGATPIVYPFIVDDVGEAMQTKRRGSAVVLSHMTPPFAAAGLQGDIADVHELMHQYKALDEGGVKRKTAKQIIAVCEEAGICKDLAWTQAKIDGDFPGFLVALHDYLEELAVQNQPLGLHSFGELAEKPLLTSTILQMLGVDQVSILAQWEAKNRSELDHAAAHAAGADHDHEIEDAHESGHDGEQAMHHSHGDDGDQIALEKLAGFSVVNDFVTADDAQTTSLNAFNAEEAAVIAKAREYFASLNGIKELDNLVNALAGRYIPVRTGGDPVRSPDSLPTGYNLYGFDPSRVPTKAAYQQGVELTDNLIANYYDKHGKYPEKLAFSLWSMETMRHYGVLEGQVLAAIGVRPVWSDDGRVIGSEIIPASELKRPRVDVVLSATGLYRDAFPNVMQWLAEAIQKVVELKESNNSLWRNAQRISHDLQESGVAEDEARYLSSVRIFSNESGAYGSGLGASTLVSDAWDADSRLANLYLSRMGYFYGADNSQWGVKRDDVKDLYAKQLSGTDIAVFSRSSNIYGLMSSDDPFQYFGGLALAVRSIDGKSPEMMISNLRNAEKAKVESAAKFMAKELRTRDYHPRWLKEMQKEGYSGATTMASRVSNFFGWQVMDPTLVRDDQWQELFEVYVQDKHELGISEWFEDVDAKAQQQIIERMLEAIRKDYWNAADETREVLVERYDELVNRHDLHVDNAKLKAFVEQTAVGFGLEVALPGLPSVSMAIDMPQEVQGQRLEKVQAQSVESDNAQLYLMLGLCLFFFAGGALRQCFRPSLAV